MTAILKFPKIIRTALLIAFAVATTSCGNYKSGRFSTSTSGINYGQTANLGALAGNGSTVANGFSCPNSPNVSSSSGLVYDTSGSFSVCTRTTDPYTIQVHGTAPSSGTICVYPIQYVDSTHVFTKPDLTTAGYLPLSTCMDVSTASARTNGATVTFSGVNYNSVIIVDQINQSDMTTCLANGAISCPQYSYGKFR